MRIIVLGGTVFLGRALVEAVRERGHEVTLFNRGQTNPDLFPDVEKLRGNRDGDLSALKGRRWDAAIDTCGYVPRVVRQSAELLAGAVGYYTFVSSVSVYSDWSKPGVDERTPLGTLEDETVEEITGETYGPLKALCEQAVKSAMPGRALIIRPGLIVGPHDPSDRFAYWVHRVAQGGEVLVPGPPTRPAEFIDVRDLAEWIVRMIEVEQTGTYNAAGPGQSVTMGQFLETCKSVSGSDAALTWVSDEFLIEQDVTPWTEMPMWIPSSDPAYAGFFAIDSSKAVAAGLTYRPVTETVGDTLEWATTRSDDHEWRAGILRERETELLEAWRP